MAFNALIQAFRPDLVDISTMSKINKQANLDHAFSLAEREIGIPRMLDAVDSDPTTIRTILGRGCHIRAAASHRAAEVTPPRF